MSWHILVALLLLARPAAAESFRALAFSKTNGFRHRAQIALAQQMLSGLAASNDFAIDFSENGDDFSSANLAQYDVVIFLYTSGNGLLDADSKLAFEQWVMAGGGTVGVHSATDTEYAWPFYGALMGAWFAGHPAIQAATLDVVDGEHPSTVHLPASFEHRDEWYNFDRDPLDDPALHGLIEVDESTYNGGTMGDRHPIAWLRDAEVGRVWYTALGHTLESGGFFEQHLLGGIEFAAVPEPGPPAAGGAVLAGLALLRAQRRGRRRRRECVRPASPPFFD